MGHQALAGVLYCVKPYSPVLSISFLQVHGDEEVGVLLSTIPRSEHGLEFLGGSRRLTRVFAWLVCKHLSRFAMKVTALSPAFIGC